MGSERIDPERGFSGLAESHLFASPNRADSELSEPTKYIYKTSNNLRN